MKMYRACEYKKKIEEREVIRTTEKMIFYPCNIGTKTECRELKESLPYHGGHKWFGDWQEAKDWLLDRIQEDVDSARSHLQRVNGIYGNIKGMKK